MRSDDMISLKPKGIMCLLSSGPVIIEYRSVRLKIIHTHLTCIIRLPKSMTAILQQKPAKKSESIRLENLQAKLYWCNK